MILLNPRHYGVRDITNNLSYLKLRNVSLSTTHINHISTVLYVSIFKYSLLYLSPLFSQPQHILSFSYNLGPLPPHELPVQDLCEPIGVLHDHWPGRGCRILKHQKNILCFNKEIYAPIKFHDCFHQPI